MNIGLAIKSIAVESVVVDRDARAVVVTLPVADKKKSTNPRRG